MYLINIFYSLKKVFKTNTFNTFIILKLIFTIILTNISTTKENILILMYYFNFIVKKYLIITVIYINYLK